MKLTDYQLDIITTMAINAYDCAQEMGKSDAALVRHSTLREDISIFLNMLAGKCLSTSDGMEVVFSNGKDKPPTRESVEKFILGL